MKTCLLLTMVQLFPLFSFGYILPLNTILSKAANRAGNSVISVEQNVIFRAGSKELIIREEWLIEGDRNLKLTASGTGPLKDVFYAHYLYNGKQRTSVSGRNRQTQNAGADFFEKYLAVKSPESFLNYLRELGISQRVRLSRAAGSISFAVGEPSAQSLNPQIWIDQDFFRVVKMRLPSESEVEFTDYPASEAFQYPRTKTVTWADKSVQIKVIKVTTARAALQDFYPETISRPSEIQMSGKIEGGENIDEFYQRFR